MELVGTEGVSIGYEEQEQRVHRELAYRDILVIENLDLANIKDGSYTLAAFPLKIEGAEAAPVRAVLLERQLGL